jgi:hypothetical protein
MTTTQATTERIEFGRVRPGMVVTTYSGRPIEVTAVRHVVRKLGEGRGWTATVVLSGWFQGRYVDACYQLPDRRTDLLRDDAQAKAARFWASVDDDDAAMMRTTHDYSGRLVTLNTNIRLELAPAVRVETMRKPELVDHIARYGLSTLSRSALAVLRKRDLQAIACKSVATTA